MALNIPTPDLPGTALMKGIQTGGNLFHQIMQPILYREQQKRLAEQFQKEYALRQAAANRSSAAASRNTQLFPYLLEKAKREADPMYAFKQLASLEGQFGGASQDKYQSFMPGIGEIFGQEQGGPNQQPQDYKALRQFLSDNFPELGLDSSQHEVNNPLSTGQQEQIPQVGVPYEKAPKSSSILSKEDFENIKRQLIYKALGAKVPAANLKGTPEQQQANAIDKAVQIDTAKEKNREQLAAAKEVAKRTETLKQSAKPLLEAAHHLEEIEKLMVSHPNATGFGRTTASNLPFLNQFYDSETINGINAHAVPLQGKIAKELSRQGGYGVAQFAESAKPSGNKNQKANIGSLLANKESILESLKLMEEDWKTMHPGKKFPYKIPEFLSKNPFESNKKEKMVNIISPVSGKIVPIPESKVDAAIKAGGRHVRA